MSLLAQQRTEQACSVLLLMLMVLLPVPMAVEMLC